jgi:hypothetical protein
MQKQYFINNVYDLEIVPVAEVNQCEMQKKDFSAFDVTCDINQH